MKYEIIELSEHPEHKDLIHVIYKYNGVGRNNILIKKSDMINGRGVDDMYSTYYDYIIKNNPELLI